MTALLLGALGLTLSLVVPGILAAARWPDRAPAAAVALWQGITLAGVLCALGVVLAGPQELISELGSDRPAGSVALIVALAVAAVIIVRLLVSLIRVSIRSRARRARHRLLVDLLDSAERHGELPAEVPAGLRVLDGPLSVAYCLPGRSPRVVLTGGALKVLNAGQVAAVIAHEQAHLRHRHDVVMESLTAFYRAVPRPLRSRAPLNAVHLLLEMVADDAARRRTGAEPLRTALELLSDAVSPDAPAELSNPPAPTGPDGAGTSAGPGGTAAQAGSGSAATPARPDSAAAERRRRLERLAVCDPRSLTVTLTAVVALGAVALLVLPTVILVLPWLDRALSAWPL